MPYFTPKMYERYFLAADVLSIIFAFYYPRCFYLPILICGVSFFSYTTFLFGYEVVPLRYLAIVQLVTLVILFRYLASGANFAGKVEARDNSPELEAGRAYFSMQGIQNFDIRCKRIIDGAKNAAHTGGCKSDGRVNTCWKKRISWARS